MSVEKKNTVLFSLISKLVGMARASVARAGTNNFQPTPTPTSTVTPTPTTSVTQTPTQTITSTPTETFVPGYEYYRFTALNSSSGSTTSNIMITEIELYTGNNQTGTDYPTVPLTSNTSQAGTTVSAGYNYTGYNPWEAFDDVSGNVGSSWWTLSISNASDNWLQIQFSNRIDINSAKIWIAANFTNASVLRIDGSNTGSFNGEETNMGYLTGISTGSSVILHTIDFDGVLPTPTPTSTPTPTPTQTLTNTPTTSVTSTPTPTPTNTNTPTQSVTSTPTNTLTVTPTNTQTITNTPSSTLTLTPTPTRTLTNTPTKTVTSTPTQTLTSTPTPTQTVTSTPASTAQSTPTPTKTLTNTPTQTVTSTNTPTLTVTSTPTKTLTPTPTKTLTNTPTQTVTSTNTPTLTVTSTPTKTLTPTPTNTLTLTNTPSQTLTSTPTKTLTPTPTTSSGGGTTTYYYEVNLENCCSKATFTKQPIKSTTALTTNDIVTLYNTDTASNIDFCYRITAIKTDLTEVGKFDVTGKFADCTTCFNSDAKFACQETFVSVDFSDQTYTNNSTLPTGWSKTPNGTALFGTTSYTINSGRGWVFDYNATGSSGTGPNGGLAGGVDATAGTQSSTNRYCFYESSSGGNGGQCLITPELNFSAITSGNDITLTFWFHMYGSSNQTQTFGVAATTSSTSSSSANEVVTGSGFSSSTAGGLSITYWTNDTGTSTSTSNRISGSQQTSNSGVWRKATVDLSSLAGESSVYIHFMLVGVTYFRSDFALDGIKIVGNL